MVRWHDWLCYAIYVVNGAHLTIKHYYYYTHRKLWAQLNLKHKPILAVSLLNNYKIVNVALPVTKRVRFHAHSIPFASATQLTQSSHLAHALCANKLLHKQSDFGHRAILIFGDQDVAGGV